MPYSIKKEKCKQSDGDSGTYRLRYTDKKGKKHSSCHSSKKNAQSSIAAIEMRETTMNRNDVLDFQADTLIRQIVGHVISEAVGLSPREMGKTRRGSTITRWEIFSNKLKSGSKIDDATGRPYNEFELTDGSVVTIPLRQNSALVRALDAQDPVAYKQAFDSGVKTAEGIIITSPDTIMKSSEFGGRGTGSGTSAEVGQIGQINDAILAAIDRNKGMPIDIVVGTGGFNGTGVAKNVVRCDKVSGTPKADAVLIDDSDNPVAYLSLKAASIPKQMNQWSGVSKHEDVDIVKSFVDDVRAWVESNGEIPSGKALVRAIPAGHPIITNATYGDQSDDSNNCDLIIADGSTIDLQDMRGRKKSFKCENIWYAREPINDPSWVPTLYARFGDRNDFGIPKTRVAIFPFEYRDASKRIALPSGAAVSSKSSRRKAKMESIRKSKYSDSSLNEELTPADKREIEKLARRQAQIEIERVVGSDLGKTIREEVMKALGSKSTKEEIAEVAEAVLKRLHRELASAKK